MPLLLYHIDNKAIAAGYCNYYICACLLTKIFINPNLFMKKIALPLLAGIIALGSCKKETADPDKQITLDFPLSFYGTGATSFENTPAYSYLIDFDKRDYPKVDSITFLAALSTYASTDTAFARLFNVTDNVEIAHSEIYSSQIKNPTIIGSNNIFSSLPDKRITLAIQVRRSASSPYYVTAGLSYAYIKLRRN